MTSNEAICKRISDLCKEQNITYYTLASRAAIPKSTLMNILSGTIQLLLPLIKYVMV